MSATKPWVALTLDDLRPYLTQDQQNKTDDATLDPTFAQCFAQVWPDVAAEVRSAVASNPRNTLSKTASSVPPELRRTAALLAIDALSEQFSTSTPLTPNQVEKLKSAKERLEAVRDWTDKGKQFLVSAPDDPETEPSMVYGPTAKVVSGEDRLLTRESTRSL